MQEAKENCPPLCLCELKGMVTIDRPQLNIDCIGLNMTKLPDIIPKGSSRFNLSHNAVSRFYSILFITFRSYFIKERGQSILLSMEKRKRGCRFTD